MMILEGELTNPLPIFTPSRPPPKGGGVHRQRCKKTNAETIVSPLFLGEGPGGKGILERDQGVRVPLEDFSFTKVVFHGFIFFSVMLLPPPGLPQKGEESTNNIARKRMTRLLSPLSFGRGARG